MNRTPTRMTFLVPAIVCVSVALALTVQLSRTVREDLYWTPREEAGRLEQARGRVEILLDDDVLLDRLQRGELRYADSGRQVVPDDLRVRFNDVDAVTRAQMIILAATVGAALAFFLASILLPRQSTAGGPATKAAS